MIEQLHIAAQYLATAGISFVEAREDDSHTNLGWSIENHELTSHPLSKRGDILALNYDHFSLIWVTEGIRDELFLKQTSHREVINWIKKMVTSNGLDKKYQYNLHYELPYSFPTDDYEFESGSKEELRQMVKLMNLAQNSIQDVLEKQQLKSAVRVWPHHFDLGAYAQVNNEVGIGFGMAIPDSAIDDFYFYVSGYKGHDALETKEFEPLIQGEWQTGDWKAATLKASGQDQNTVSNFLNEAIVAFTNQ